MNPKDIPAKDFPLIVLSHFKSGLFEFLITLRTNGHYSHIMWATRPNTFASQGNTFSEVDMSRYMRKGNTLKFIEIIGLTPVQKNLILAAINQDLKLPWYKKIYDWVGVIGQLIGIKWINIEGLSFCSERAIRPLAILIEYLNDSDLKEILSLIPVHASPEDLNEYFKIHSKIFHVYGKWDSDDENSTCASAVPIALGLC